MPARCLVEAYSKTTFEDFKAGLVGCCPMRCLPWRDPRACRQANLESYIIEQGKESRVMIINSSGAFISCFEVRARRAGWPRRRRGPGPLTAAAAARRCRTRASSSRGTAPNPSRATP